MADDWSNGLRSLDREEFATALALSHQQENQTSPIVSHTWADQTDHAIDAEIEIWAEDAEGVYKAVTELFNIPVPKTVAEAMESQYWPLFKAAMEEEIKGKMDNRAWDVVPRPRNKHVMKGKWVFAIKYEEDGSIKRVKGRFVACGYSQVETEDYGQVFAATLPWVSLRILLCCICDEDLETDQMDAVKAFTQPAVDRELYCEMPEGFESDGYVLFLLKALEGIHQGAFLWFQHNKAALTKLGFVSWINEPNLYVHEKLGIRIGVFVDDTLAAFHSSVTEEYKAIKAEYAKLVNIGTESISPVMKFGMQITRNRSQRTITVRQTQYIEQMVEEYKNEVVARAGDSPWH